MVLAWIKEDAIAGAQGLDWAALALAESDASVK